MVLEYGEQSLRELLRREQLSESRCRTVAERLVVIIRHLHACGVGTPPAAARPKPQSRAAAATPKPRARSSRFASQPAAHTSSLATCLLCLCGNSPHRPAPRALLPRRRRVEARRPLPRRARRRASIWSNSREDSLAWRQIRPPAAYQAASEGLGATPRPRMPTAPRAWTMPMQASRCPPDAARSRCRTWRPRWRRTGWRASTVAPQSTAR